MRPPFYLRQLVQDLDQWIAAGLVPAENRERILASVGAQEKRHALPVVFAIMGVVLLGAAAMSFVAANWAAMGELERLIVLFGAMGLSGALAAFLHAKSQKWLADAAVLLTVILFGVAIMFVGQTYHMESGWPDGLMLWATGALIAALIIPSRAAFSVALIIGTVWTVTATYETPHEVHWPFLGFLAAAVAGRVWRNWQTEFHLTMAAFLVWLGFNTSALAETLALGNAELIALLSAVFLMLWLAAHLVENSYVQSRSLARYGLIGAFVLFFILHWAGAEEGVPTGVVLAKWLAPGGFAFALSVVIAGLAAARRALSPLDLIAAALFAAAALAYPILASYWGDDRSDLIYTILLGVFIVWGIAHAARADDRLLVNLGFAGFAAWTLYLYADYFSSLLDQAMFFAVGGILLVGIGFVLELTRRRVLARAAGGGP